MNDFLDAINDSDEEDEKPDTEASEERYNELKKEEADVDSRSPAKQRYQELKEKAKKEMIEEEFGPDEEEEEEDEEYDSGDEEEFITY